MRLTRHHRGPSQRNSPTLNYRKLSYDILIRLISSVRHLPHAPCPYLNAQPALFGIDLYHAAATQRLFHPCFHLRSNSSMARLASASLCRRTTAASTALELALLASMRSVKSGFASVYRPSMYDLVALAEGSVRYFYLYLVCKSLGLVLTSVWLSCCPPFWAGLEMLLW